MQLLGNIGNIWSATSGDIYYSVFPFIYGDLHVASLAHEIAIKFYD
jgi:hypothetical protein